ncbi:phage tail protein [Erythrobacter sp. THAF29]|uniref:phage tail protein n=1 Tax=Erythrobacter sp. THAF29 TaxID=2587851 RepID=UPI00126843A1|nr:tail fiber protein [Erythrobacter sp. THAF29]QFT78500.1 Phage Tail Collar Domain protein [Erythrobacter sp. THAF29]
MKKLSLLTAAAVALASFSAVPQPAKAQSDPLLGQLMLFGGNFCPRGWSRTDGQLLAINSNQALFSLLGTMYGGDGRTTFGLPDLRGRAPISTGQGPGLPNYLMGQKGGTEAFTLTVSQMPSHTHTGTMRASTQIGNSANPNNKVLAVDPAGDKMYHVAGATNNMAADSLVISNTGGNQAVNKLSPFTTMQWCIALVGTFPSRN